MKLRREISKITGKRIYLDQDNNVYPSSSRVSNEFFSTYGLYLWTVKLGKQIATTMEDGHLLTDKELYLLGKPEGDRLRDEAAIRGSEIHRCIELEEYSTNPEYQDYLDNYYRFLAPYVTVEQAEVTLGYVCTENRRVAGTADVKGRWKDINSILDFKTSEKIKNPRYFGSYSLQLSCYALGWEYEFGEPINQGVILNILPDDATAFKIDLTYSKQFLRTVLLPAYYRYYSIPQETRGYANKFIPKQMRDYERELQKHIEIE